MGMLDWLFGGHKRAGSTATKDEKRAVEPNHGFRWYFLSVGHAMGPRFFVQFTRTMISRPSAAAWAVGSTTQSFG